MKRINFLLVMLLATVLSYGQSAAAKKNVEKLCGCFDVEFKYAETFSPDTAYKFHNRDEISGGLELVLPVETSDKKIVLQHLLVITDSMIIKHWRETWTYEDPTLWKYQGNNTWTKEELSPEKVKGKWTQSVWEVSDAPRYQGTSEWINTDGKTFWENTADAPLPRREYSVRNDYNIFKRENKIIVTDSGWIHDQDNEKIIRNNGTDKLLVEEKGINSYKRVDEKQCAAAKFFWEKNKDYWTRVRNIWENYLANASTVTVKSKVDGKALYEYLFDFADQYSKGKIPSSEIDAKISSSIESFASFGKETAAIK